MRSAEEMRDSLDAIERGIAFQRGEVFDDKSAAANPRAAIKAAQERVRGLRSSFIDLVMRASTGDLEADRTTPARTTIVLGPEEQRRYLGIGRPMVELTAYAFESATPLMVGELDRTETIRAQFFYGDFDESDRPHVIRVAENHSIDFDLVTRPPKLTDKNRSRYLGELTFFEESVPGTLAYITQAADNAILNPPLRTEL